VAIIVTQVVGDSARIFMRHSIRGAVGVTIAGALLFYLPRPQVRAAFVASRALER
jgi:hypothetical protein